MKKNASLEKMSAQKLKRMAEKANKGGNIEEAKKYLKVYLDKFPANTEVRDKLRQMELTEKNLGEITTIDLKRLINHVYRGELSKAKNELNFAIENHRPSNKLYNIRAAVNLKLGLFREAIIDAEASLKVAPTTDALNNKTSALIEIGNFEEANLEIDKIFRVEANNSIAHLNRAEIHRRQGDFQSALVSLEASLLVDYNELTLLKMGEIYRNLKDYDTSAETFKKVLKLNPISYQALNNLGIVSQQCMQFKKAEDYFLRAIKSEPKNLLAYNNIGALYRSLGRIEDAICNYELALTREPNNILILRNLAAALRDSGQIDAAIQLYRNAANQQPPDITSIRMLSNLQNGNVSHELCSKIHSLDNNLELSLNQKCELKFAMAKVHEARREYTQAFKSYVTGNQLRKKILKYDVSYDRQILQKLKVQTYELISKPMNLGKEENNFTPIFIVGLPRSGTTLLEQIVSAHQHIEGAGELETIRRLVFEVLEKNTQMNTEAIAFLRSQYKSELQNRFPGSLFVTDKQPLNFRFIPFIRSAFPESKIIHIKRDRWATCWSIFKHYFAGSGLGFSYDLRDILEYYEMYMELMNFYSDVYGDHIYRCDYELLCQNPELEIPRIIKYIGVDWDNACLQPEKNRSSVRTASVSQVRRKIYTGSSDEWRKYEPLINQYLAESTR